ncbi:MAG: hypothetical protein COA50_00290 [Flavobacteriaceae bacterium]|nr:MAG: hypothetical protein COA50_00290 [Flavobacteriaceae bacterium]
MEENALVRILNPDSFYDLILIALGEKMKKTCNHIYSNIKEINDDDSEPFIADSINKIDTFCRIQGFC